MNKMKALVIHGIEDARLEEIDIPKIEDDEVLIRVRACGICGSDLPRALDGSVHSFPIVLGHEFSGDVVAVGKDIKDITIGNRVTAAPLLPCGKCNYCKVGKPAMCKSYNFLGSRKNGAMAEYVAIKAENIVLIPQEVDYISGAMIEPITVAIHGIQRIKVLAGATAVVFGAGTIGLLTLQCLKAIGAGKVYVIDIVQEKLEIAKELGADEVINAMNIDIVKYFEVNDKPSVVFETSGSIIAQRQCLEIASKLGKVVYIGTATKSLELPPHSFEKILRGELEVTGSWMSYSAPYPGYEWTTAVRFIKEGKINTKLLVTNLCKLEDGINPFKIMRDKGVCSIKVMFEI